VARPSEKELAEVKHHFIASHSIQNEMDAAAFEKSALQITIELFKKHDVVIMVGGTGLYIKAFCDGLDAIPTIDISIREKIIKAYKEKGLSWLQEEVKEKDPGFYKVGEIKNPQRMMRALEVVESTGKSILEFRRAKKTPRDFKMIKIGLELPKEELHRNINRRVDDMFEQGLVEEAKGLLPYKNLNALQTVGYKEIFEYVDEKFSLEQATEEIKKNSRQYAKRQMTWFKKDKEIKWFSPAEEKKLIEFVLSN
jgi:tRNA dimethylallyltransferase